MYISNYCNYYFISIHAPAKGATRHTHASILLAAFQSTLPRRERHFLSRSRCASSRISIHAPAKGATDADIDEYFHKLISIHAPAKGATHCFLASTPSYSFQSTLPRRERLLSTTVSDGMYYISIHAPAKGATEAVFLFIHIHINISIHAPAKGATRIEHIKSGEVRFQSTLPRRERPVCRPGPCESTPISIHAPAKGATRLCS